MCKVKIPGWSAISERNLFLCFYYVQGSNSYFKPAEQSAKKVQRHSELSLVDYILSCFPFYITHGFRIVPAVNSKIPPNCNNSKIVYERDISIWIFNHLSGDTFSCNSRFRNKIIISLDVQKKITANFSHYITYRNNLCTYFMLHWTMHLFLVMQKQTVFFAPFFKLFFNFLTC